MKYPRVMTEDKTMDLALAGRCLSRFGDGELRLAKGGTCTSQSGDPMLAQELREILAGKAPPAVLPCIPRIDDDCPRRKQWMEGYATNGVLRMYELDEYGSAFITRPDNAPVIDRPDYWEKIRQIWAGKRTCLVSGDEKSLRPDMMQDAASLRTVSGPRQHAYGMINEIERECLKQSDEIYVLCLGATATVLAARLAAAGAVAQDLGHVGMFMRHAGAYAMSQEQLISRKYQKILVRHHEETKWGSDGWRRAGAVLHWLIELGGRTVLDYGCGKGKLKQALEPPYRVFEYDPAIPGKDDPPKTADLVLCADVLEHVEPDKLDAVIRHVLLLASKGTYFIISTRAANNVLPDGRNAHLTVKDDQWWTEKVQMAGAKIARREVHGHGLHLWTKK